MRKALKFKTSLMLLAWSVIFLHGIIPHNHHDHRDARCTHIYHHTSEGRNDAENTSYDNPLIKSIPVHEEQKVLVCHFSAELIHLTDLDQVFINENGYHNPPLAETVNQYINAGSSASILKPAYSLMPLRAPPPA